MKNALKKVHTETVTISMCTSKSCFLSDEELLAVILRTGNRELNSMELARTIITKENKTDILSIMHYTFEELTSFKGIGTVKAIQIMCIGELSK